MTTPADREFEVMARGHVRDKVILANFRNGLRALLNPETGQPFAEDEIARATQAKSRWFIEADSIDQYTQSEQRGAVYLSDQARIERASSAYLEGFHARLWSPEGRLKATGGSGSVTVPAVAGTIIVGSTTVPDPAAYQARDGAGKKYQVFTTVVTPTSGQASVTMVAIDTGTGTNLEVGEKLTWINRDPNMQPECAVAEDFSGGTDTETDAEWSSRMIGTIRHKQGAGNDAQMRGWARRSSNAIEDGYVYPCALHAGSTIIAITQKRAGVKGPTGRIPSPGTLAQAIAYLTPPGSPTIPARALFLVTPANGESSDFVVRLAMAKGSSGGWTDVQPFPAYHATTPSITTVTSPADIRVTALGDTTLPGQAALATLSGVSAPQMMVWNPGASEWEKLAIASVEDLGSNVYRVLLSAPASFDLAIGQIVSPDMVRRAVVQGAVTEYFDELGPGNLFDLNADARGARCVRFPRAVEERPFRAGAVLAARMIEALGGSASDATLASMSLTEPTYPTDLSLGPKMLVAGTAGIYPL
jgi:hypothetical protein